MLPLAACQHKRRWCATGRVFTVLFLIYSDFAYDGVCYFGFLHISQKRKICGVIHKIKNGHANLLTLA